MIREPGQKGEPEIYQDGVLDLLEQFPSPISSSSPVTPAMGCVSLPIPSCPSKSPALHIALATNKNPDTHNEFNHCQRCSGRPLFSPLFQEKVVLQEPASQFSRDVQGLFQVMVPDSFATEHKTLAQSPSNLPSLSLGGASEIRARSYWTEEVLSDEYRCQCIQGSRFDTTRAARDSSVIFYDPFAVDGGDDEEGERDEEDLPIEDLRNQLKLVTPLLPQSPETMTSAVDPTRTPCAQARRTEEQGLAGIGCGSSNRSPSGFWRSPLDVDSSPSVRVHPLPPLSTVPPVVNSTFVVEYSPSVAPTPLAKANHDEPKLKRGIEGPFREYLPADFELALGGTSRYPPFPNLPRPRSRSTISPRAVVTKQPPDRSIMRPSPSVTPSLVCDLLPSRPDNAIDHSQKGFSEPRLISKPKRLGDDPDLEDVSGVGVQYLTNTSTTSRLPAAFGIRGTKNTGETEVQTADRIHDGLTGARKSAGGSNWRPPTCWEIPELEPAREFIGERNDRGYIDSVATPTRVCGVSSGSVEPVLAFVSGSRAGVTCNPSPSSTPKISTEMQSMGRTRRSGPLSFIHGLTQQRSQLGSRSPHPSNFWSRA
jgi:hypothetical protein